MQTAIISAPFSKSLSHRALMAAGLGKGICRLSQVLESDDTARTREILGSLGAVFERTGPGCFSVTGTGGRVFSNHGPLSVNVGESGTTCRLITAILAAGRGAFRIHGKGRMHERPLGELTGVLSGLGARISFEGNEGCPPLVLEANGLRGNCRPEAAGNDGAAVISAQESSQYISGLLLAAPLGTGMTICLGGTRAVSWPYVGLTLEVMEHFGIAFVVQERTEQGWRTADWRKIKEARPGLLRFCVRPGLYQSENFTVEGDWSGASYFLAAGAVGPRPVRVLGLNLRSLQGDAALLDILRAMGARVTSDDAGITVFPAPLRGVEVDMGHCPDLVPTVAAVAAHATGETRIRNVAHLKIKESDRLAAPARELAKAGCAVAVLDDGLVILPPEHGPRLPEHGVFSAHNDHRMAMSLSLLGLPGLCGKGFSVPLDNPECVAKSFPHFWSLWEKVRA